MRSGGCGRPSWALAAAASSSSSLVVVVLLVVTTSCTGASGAQKISQTAMAHATDTAAGHGGMLGFQAAADLLSGEPADVWLCSLVGSLIIGLSGIFPLLIIPIEAGAALKTEAGCQKLKQLLSFAIGGLLGDVFLHLLPEAWALSGSSAARDHQQYLNQGLWVILGLLSFLLLEKMFPDQDPVPSPVPISSLNRTTPSTSAAHKNGTHSETRNGSKPQHSPLKEGSEKIKTSGYLNLLANCIDNFTHGLAVAGSFMVSKKVGILTTFAILLHEIPHEVGDFAILLRAGFDRWSAARMQLYTALVGLLGASCALCAQSPEGTESATAWILPFTAGGFLHIALVNVMPDLLDESSWRQSLSQILLICCGVAVMAFLSTVVD